MDALEKPEQIKADDATFKVGEHVEAFVGGTYYRDLIVSDIRPGFYCLRTEVRGGVMFLAFPNEVAKKGDGKKLIPAVKDKIRDLEATLTCLEVL